MRPAIAWSVCTLVLGACDFSTVSFSTDAGEKVTVTPRTTLDGGTGSSAAVDSGQPSGPSTPTSEARALHTLRVLELRYYPRGEADVVHHPDTLSAQLRAMLREGSRYRGDINPSARPSLDVEIVGVVNRFKARPNVDGSWGTTYAQVLQEDNLCQRIIDEDIDQVWMWVDPRPGRDPNPGVEYVISSRYFQHGVQYATVATPPLCGGQKAFVMMGFDTSRTADLALHSFGHYLEGLLGNLLTVELFWYRFGGNTKEGFPLTERCGNVHFPPNGQADYDYGRVAPVTNYCDAWNSEALVVPGNEKSVGCQAWGCNQEGWLKWWMQHLPGLDNPHTYQGRQLPNWWDFVVDMDAQIETYRADPRFFLNRAFVEQNVP